MPAKRSIGDFEKLHEFETQILEAIKIAAQMELSAQIAHDVRVQTHLSMMTDRLIVQLSTYIYGMKTEHQTQRVPYERTISRSRVVQPERTISLACLVLGLIVGALAIPFTGNGPIIDATPFVALGVVIVAAVDLLTARPTVIDIEETVHGEVEIDAESWVVFPENSMVFPKELGRPRQIVRYSQPRYFGND